MASNIEILKEISNMASNFHDPNWLSNFIVRDGNGIKGLMDLGLKEVPATFIQPQESRINKRNAGRLDEPPIDVSNLDGPDRDRLVEQMVRAAETLGFFQVVNHGVPVELLEAVKEAAHGFFEQPVEKKAVYLKDASPSQPLVTYGTSFAPEKEKALVWKDKVSLNYVTDADSLKYWPEGCRKVVLEYMKKSTILVRKLLKILIGKLGVTIDDDKIDALTGRKMVNMNYYPPCPSPELTIGAARHTDMGLLTVLLQDEIGGLFIKNENDFELEQKAEWLEIPPIPGALVINVGDALQILSNGRYKSVEHLVQTSTDKSRVSIPLFTSPVITEMVAPFPEVVEEDGVAHYRELLFGDYMKNFYETAAAHGNKKCLEFAKIH